MTDEKTYSAKQVATRIGTDAKTLRKFFRSSASPFTAVGQGGRYEFPAKQLPDIEKAFTAWSSGKTVTASTPKPRKGAPVNGKTRPPRRQKHKVDVEPGEHRGLPYTPKPSKLNATEFAAERAARQAARDEEYGTIDGEEPTEEDLLEIDDVELELDDEDED